MSDPKPSAATAPAIQLRDAAVAELQNLSMTVAEEINWTVNAGEFWVVAGSQGVGKSDLIMLLGGLIPPARGTYHFFGEPMPIFEEERLAHRLRLGLVFEDGQLFDRMTVAENVALPLQYHRDLSDAEASERVDAMLEWTGLSPFASRAPRTLPVNWRKRAGLARALMMTPEVLLLNNPLTGLDARHAQWWLNFLGRLARGKTPLGDRPTTIIAAANDLSPATGWRGRVDRVACLTQRRLVTFRDWPELEQCPDPAVQDLLDARPLGD